MHHQLFEYKKVFVLERVSGNMFLPVPDVFLLSKQSTKHVLVIFLLILLLMRQQLHLMQGLKDPRLPGSTHTGGPPSFTCSFCYTCESWATYTVKGIFTALKCVINKIYDCIYVLSALVFWTERAQSPSMQKAKAHANVWMYETTIKPINSRWVSVFASVPATPGWRLSHHMLPDRQQQLQSAGH